MPAVLAQKGTGIQTTEYTKSNYNHPPCGTNVLPSSNVYDVSELGTALKFDEEVVLSRCPHSIGYKKALEISLNDALHPSHHYARKDRKPLGRHNCRGELKRHVPCHLRSQSLPLDVKLITAAPRPFVETSVRKPTPTANSSIAGASARPKEFPAPLPEEWEAKTLLRLSSATARRFRRLGGLHGQQDLAPTDAEPATSTAASTSREQREAAHSLASEKFQDRREPASTSTSPATTARFLVEFLSGALPVHRPRCTDATILLDNKSKFEKVLQDKFPQAPQEWCPGDTAPHVARKCIRGVQRWTNLPQPAEVFHLVNVFIYYVSVKPSISLFLLPVHRPYTIAIKI